MQDHFVFFRGQYTTRMKNILLAGFLCFSILAAAQKTDKPLKTKLQEAISGYNGDIGIYVKNLRTGKTVAFNADTIFPTASIVKVPILVGGEDGGTASAAQS